MPIVKPKRTNHPRKRWCFTLNNYTEDELAKIKETLTEQNCIYAVVGKEVGESGTPHLQGFVHLKVKKRIGGVKDIVGNRAHLEMARGTDSQNEVYCSKDADVVVSVGTPAKGGTENGGGFAMAENILTEVQRRIDSPMEDWREDAERLRLYLRHEGLIERLTETKKQNQAKSVLAETYRNCEFYQWQRELLQDLECDPDDRIIIWYVDKEGNSGKTWLSRYLLLERSDVIRFENGRSADVKFAYRGQRIVIFDYSRSVEGHLNYEVIESIKNGLIFNSKYESRSLVYAIPHVVVFANFEPDKDKLSADRWDIRFINNKHD